MRLRNLVFTMVFEPRAVGDWKVTSMIRHGAPSIWMTMPRLKSEVVIMVQLTPLFYSDVVFNMNCLLKSTGERKNHENRHAVHQAGQFPEGDKCRLIGWRGKDSDHRGGGPGERRNRTSPGKEALPRRPGRGRGEGPHGGVVMADF